MKIFSVIGYKNSGKTTLCERLTGELSSRGLKVGYIKHVHCEMKMTDDDTDTGRVRASGAAASLAVSPQGFNLTSKDGIGDELIEMIFKDYDIVLKEGYKDNADNSIVMMHCTDKTKDIGEKINARTVLTVGKNNSGIKSIEPDDITKIADFILAL